MLEGFVHESILARAQKKGLAEIHLHNLRDYTTDKWRRVDDYPYGGFAGMVMQCEPIDRAISALKAERDYDEVIFTSPDGEQFSQGIANDMSMLHNIIILCGHLQGHRPAHTRPPHHPRNLHRRLRAHGGRTGGGGDGGCHRAPGAGRHQRRPERPLRLFPRQPALGSHLHPTGRLQGMEGARHSAQRQ